MGIRTKFILPSLFISVVACGSLAFLGLKVESRLTTQAQLKISEASIHIAEYLQSNLDKETKTVEALTNNQSWNSVIKSGEYDDAIQLLLQSLEGYQVEVAAIFDREQNILFTTNKPPMANQFYGAGKFIKSLEKADEIIEFQNKNAYLRKFFIKIDERTYPVITARFIDDSFHEHLSKVTGLVITENQPTTENKDDNQTSLLRYDLTDIPTFAGHKVWVAVNHDSYLTLVYLLIGFNGLFMIVGLAFYSRQASGVSRSEQQLAKKLKKLSKGLPSDTDITEWRLKPVSQLKETETAILHFLENLQKNINQISLKVDKLNIERIRIEAAKKKLASERDLALQAPKQRADFFSRMADEITVPLNGVNSMLNLLDEYKLQEEPAKLVSLCRTAANTLIASVNNMMDFYKLDAGKFEVKRRPFEVVAVIEELRASYQPLAANKGLRFETKVAREVPSTINSDKQRIIQLIDIFINNAITFTEKGDVGIFVDFQSVAGKKSVRFSIKDSGIGMSKDAAQELLDSLTVRAKISKASFAGRLKLIVAKRIAEAMGGEIGVNSEQGVGSRFWFTVNI